MAVGRAPWGTLWRAGEGQVRAQDGANNVLDVALAALNSTLVEPHDSC